MDYIHDIKGWLTPHLRDIHGHSTPLSFKFNLNVDEKAQMRLFLCTDGWSDEAPTILKVIYVE